MNLPEDRSPVPHNPNEDKGSIWLGIGLFFAVLAANAVLGAIIYGVIEALGQGYSSGALTLTGLPMLLFIGVLVYLLAKGKTRTALGLVIPLIVLFGLALLVVAACFGMLSTSGFH